MAISGKTRKILWAKSGNRCALCKCELVMESPESSSITIVGEECHIVAQSNGGPRAGLISTDRVDEYDNLILLCRNHHRVIDDQYNNYPPAELQRIKLDHERWVKNQLSENNRSLPVSTSPPNDSDVVSAAIIAQLSALQKSLSGTVNEQLDSAQEEIHQGNTIKVETKLAEIRSGQNWQHLLPEVQARVIRLQASLQLQSGNIDGAEALATEADAFDVQKEPRLRAIIAYRKFGLEKGLEVLGEPASQDGLHLRISMLLEDSQAEEAVRLLENNPHLVEPHAETERLKAFAWLIQGDRKKAYDTILLAEKLKPSWPSIQRAGAMMRL